MGSADRAHRPCPGPYEEGPAPQRGLRGARYNAGPRRARGARYRRAGILAGRDLPRAARRAATRIRADGRAPATCLGVSPEYRRSSTTDVKLAKSVIANAG